MEDIAENYCSLYHDFNMIYMIARQEFDLALKYRDKTDDIDSALIYLEQAKNEIEQALEKAQKYDELRLKQSQGGKKSANNMTKEERIERAKKAGSSK